MMNRQRALHGYFFLLGLSAGLFPAAMMSYQIYPHPSFLWAGYTAVAAMVVWGLVIASTEGKATTITNLPQRIKTEWNKRKPTTPQATKR